MAIEQRVLGGGECMPSVRRLLALRERHERVVCNGPGQQSPAQGRHRAPVEVGANSAVDGVRDRAEDRSASRWKSVRLDEAQNGRPDLLGNSLGALELLE